MTEAIDLTARRADTSAAIAELEREQGAALLDGKPFDADLLAARRGELEAISAAELESSRRAREAEAAAAAELRSAQEAEARQELDSFRSTIADAERHAAALAASLRAAIGHGRKLGASSRLLRLPQCSVLDGPTALTKALSLAVGESLSGIERPRIFGHFRWPSTFGSNWTRLATEIEKPFLSLMEGADA